MKRKFYNDSQSTIGYTFHSQWCFAFSSPHSFQFIILSHFVVQLLLHSVKEVSTAMVFASSDIGVETIAVLGFDAEELVHGLRQVLELHIAITLPITQMPYTISTRSTALPVHFTNGFDSDDTGGEASEVDVVT